MKRAIIESPYAGDVARNVRYARLCLRDSLARGEFPLASHLLYPQVLDDNDPADRTLGIAAGLSWRTDGVQPIFYCDRGWSKGMDAATKGGDSNGYLMRRLWPATFMHYPDDTRYCDEASRDCALAFREQVVLSDAEFDRLCDIEEAKYPTYPRVAFQLIGIDPAASPGDVSATEYFVGRWAEECAARAGDNVADALVEAAAIGRVQVFDAKGHVVSDPALMEMLEKGAAAPCGDFVREGVSGLSPKMLAVLDKMKETHNR